MIVLKTINRKEDPMLSWRRFVIGAIGGRDRKRGKNEQNLKIIKIKTSNIAGAEHHNICK
jgi:hypothetical protein